MFFITETGIGKSSPRLMEGKFQEKPDIFGYQVYRALKLMLSLDQGCDGRSQKISRTVSIRSRAIPITI